MPQKLPNSARLVINIRLVEGNKKGMGVSTIRLSQLSGLRIAPTQG